MSAVLQASIYRELGVGVLNILELGKQVNQTIPKSENIQLPYHESQG